MARRGHNEGTIFQRSNGRWVAEVSLGDGQRKTLYGKTKKEVREKRDAALRAVEQGLPLGDDRQTVGEYLRSWLPIVAPTVRPWTWQRHREFVELHIVPALGHVRLNRLTAHHIQAFYADLLNKTGLSSTTVNHLHGTLHKALDKAVLLDLVPRNVSDLVDVPAIRETEIHPLTLAQARALLDGTAGTRRHALYALALDSGMREGELLGLQWRNVDLAGGVVRVEQTLKWDKDKREFVLSPPKTKRSRRQIALAPETLEALRRHRLEQSGEAAALGEAWSGGEWDLVFSTRRGTPLSASNVYHEFLRALAGLGLPRVRFHDLRHTCATLALIARVNPKVVSERLGHASVSITLDIYSHVIPDMQADAAAVLGELLYRGDVGGALAVTLGASPASERLGGAALRSPASERLSAAGTSLRSSASWSGGIGGTN